MDRGGAGRQLPGADARGETLQVTLAEVLEISRRDAREPAGEGYEEIPIAV
jgi:hypothetical protein